MTILAIETKYKGYRFRSRLEARWAVFFDALGVKWEYEKEGYDLGEAGWYLPDFWLPEQQVIVEIKPGVPGGVEARKVIVLNEVLSADRERAFAAGEDGETEGDELDTTWRVWVFAGEPYAVGADVRYQVLIPWGPDHLSGETKLESHGLRWTHCPLCARVAVAAYSIPFGHYNSEGYYTEGLHCDYCDVIDRNWKETPETWFYKGTVETKRHGFILGSPRLRSAYEAARSARFEFGESG